jgi:hypothetical protein
MNCSTSN